MLENNTFRLGMMIGGVVIVALMVGMFFTVPIQDIDDHQKETYENVMKTELPDDRDYLTAYQVLMFSLEAKTRGSVSHY